MILHDSRQKGSGRFAVSSLPPSQRALVNYHALGRLFLGEPQSDPTLYQTARSSQFLVIVVKRKRVLGASAMDTEVLLDMARHQAWADAAHWKTLRENTTLLEDVEIRARLNHMLMALKMLTTLARGETPDAGGMKEIDSIDELEAAMVKTHGDLAATLESADLDKMIALPRGPKGPFEAPAGVLLVQAITHSQHHRGQNASRMRQLGATPPMTDFVIWYALGRP
jgi:uncharacterized damage-inducible protein DinB